MRAWLTIFFLSAALPAATPAPSPQNVGGAWIDSQCNVYDFTQSGAALRIEAKHWKFDAPNAPTVYEGPLALEGRVGPAGFEADQRVTGVRLTGALREKWLDTKLLVRGETYELPLCPRSSKLAVGCSAASAGKPERLEIRSAAVSNVPGRAVPAMVYVIDAQGRPVRARTSLGVSIKAGARTQSLNIARDAPFGATFIEVGQSGPIDVRAETAGLRSSAKAIFGCAISAPRALNVVLREPRPRVGATIPLVVAVFGPVSESDDMIVTPQWEAGSVGRLVGAGSLIIPAGRCATEALLTSDEPGNSRLRMALAAAGVNPAAITVSWRRTMTPLLIALAAAGGLVGVLLSKLFQTKTAWRRRDIGIFVRGVLAGVVVYLMYFNLVALLRDPGGNVTAFVVGAAAGYVGKAALDRFARRTLAGGDSSKKGQSFRAKTA
jgi:hypothetical protein